MNPQILNEDGVATTNQKYDFLCNCFYCLMTIKSHNSHICLTLSALWCYMPSVVQGLFPWTGTLTVYYKLSEASALFPPLSDYCLRPCIFQLQKVPCTLGHITSTSLTRAEQLGCVSRACMYRHPHADFSLHATMMLLYLFAPGLSENSIYSVKW
jgi:hypothetical protein